MKHISILVLILFIAASSFAQSSYQSYGLYTTSHGNLSINLPRGREFTEKSVVGPSSFLFEDYVPGQIFSSKGIGTSYSKLRFNVETNELEVLFGNKEFSCTPDLIEGFSLETEDGDRIFIKAFSSATASFEFMEVILSNQHLMVLQDRNVVLKKGDYNPALMVGKKDTFIEQSFYYLAEDGMMQPIITGKKKVLALFSGKSKQVSEYAHSQKLGYSNIEDVLKLIEFYSSLK